MKITGIEINQYAKPLAPPFLASWDPNPRVKFASTIVYVYTDEGITGIGSGDLMTGFAGHEKFFIGKDPFEMENHNKIIDNIDFHYGRCWPLDIALWDIIGKKCGQPIYKLLGGKQDKIKAYCSCGARIPAEERAEKAREYVEMGFKAMKIRFHHEDVREDIKVVEAVRGAIGDKMEIMVDGNQAWKMPWDVERIWDLKKAVKVARELEKLGVYWLEEPLHHADYDNLARLRAMTCTSRIRCCAAALPAPRRLPTMCSPRELFSVPTHGPMAWAFWLTFIWPVLSATRNTWNTHLIRLYGRLTAGITSLRRRIESWLTRMVTCMFPRNQDLDLSRMRKR